MRLRLCVALMAVSALAGCGVHDNSQPLTADQKTTVESGVRSFMADVATDISANGPTAWQKHFVDDPSFFMAAEGQLMFPNGQPMGQWVQSITSFIKTIHLQWGEPIRIDPLTATLAIIGAPYVEVTTSPQGQQMTTRGYFTALAEYRNGHWQFRDAHWSSAPPPAGKNP